MKFTYLIFLFLFLSSCTKNDYVFENGDQKLILKLENGNQSLHLNEPSTMKLTLDKINLNDLSLLGPITANVITRQELDIFVTPTNKNVINGFVEIKVGFKGENKQKVSHKFLIPVED